MVQTIEEYTGSDTTCTGTQQYSVVFTASYVVGADITTPAGAKIIDATPSKVEVTIKTADQVIGFNTISACGKSDWAIDVAADVTASDCNGDGSRMGDPIFDIYDVDGTTLKFGEKEADDTAKTAAKRPTALSTKDDVYTKQ